MSENTTQLVNEYRALSWKAVFLLIAGSYSFTILGMLYLSQQNQQTTINLSALAADVQVIRDRQNKAITSADYEHKALQNQIDNIKK